MPNSGASPLSDVRCDPSPSLLPPETSAGTGSDANVTASVDLRAGVAAPFPCGGVDPGLSAADGTVDNVKLRSFEADEGGEAGRRVAVVAAASAAMDGSLSTEPCVDMRKLRSLDADPGAPDDRSGERRNGRLGACSETGDAEICTFGRTPVSLLSTVGCAVGVAGDETRAPRAKNEPMPAPHELRRSLAPATAALRSGGTTTGLGWGGGGDA